MKLTATGVYQRIIAPEAGSNSLRAFVESNGNLSVFFRGHRYSFGFTGGLQAGRTICFAISSSDWSSGVAANASLFVAGKNQSANIFYVENYGAAYGDNRVSVGSDTEGNASPNLLISALCYWPDRHLPNALLRSLSENPWQLIEPEIIPLFFSTVTAQYARPTSDVSSGTWTASSGSDLFAMLDETTAGDADYITTANASTCEVALGSLTDPAVSTGHIVRYRLSADAGGITVRLRQGTTTIATWTHAPAPASLTLYEQTLSSGEANSITDYTALRLQFEATS